MRQKNATHDVGPHNAFWLPNSGLDKSAYLFCCLLQPARVHTGCDCYAYGLLAAGHADLVVEADLKPYDYMALVPVIQVLGTRW
jgi:fructose-1,6-bisphosphatase/inositol monophosphatase family enzyme